VKALIVGCGDVGVRLGLAWAADGVEVYGVRRRAGAIPAPIRSISGDACDVGTYRTLPTDIDFVVYAAAAGAPGDEGAYRRAYVDGPRALLEHLASGTDHPKSIVFASSTAVYAQVDGSTVDEDSATEPSGFRGRLLLEGERLVLFASANARVVRLGGIYGPGRTQLIEAVRAGRVGLSEDGSSSWTNRIHVEDAARLLRFVAELPAGAPQVMLGVDREPVRRDDVVRWLASRLGIEPSIGGALPGRGGDKRCSSDRVTALGFAFLYPDFRAGYGALLGGGG
jgi:nucleoside-diphosphate-sugar epimerase